MSSHGEPTRKHDLYGCLRTLALALLFVVSPATRAADRLMPYLGRVDGTIVSDLSFQNPVASATTVSSVLGKGPQVYRDLALQLWEENGLTFLQTEGIAITTAANGDLLHIRFTLLGVFTSPSTVAYTGDYEVTPGGTGRFAYPHQAGNLGHGSIAGQATVNIDPENGMITYSFQHRFGGTLLHIFGARGR